MTVGQVDVFGNVSGIDKIVKPPNVIEADGLKVVHFVVSEDDRDVPGYVDEVRNQARKLEPEVKSRGKPLWMTAEWQARQRKKRAGVL